jgi:hypothetical protein
MGGDQLLEALAPLLDLPVLLDLALGPLQLLVEGLAPLPRGVVAGDGLQLAAGGLEVPALDRGPAGGEGGVGPLAALGLVGEELDPPLVVGALGMARLDLEPAAAACAGDSW